MADCQHWVKIMQAEELEELKSARNSLLEDVRIAQNALAELRAIINQADAALGRATTPELGNFSTTYNDMALRQLGRMAESPLAQELRQNQQAFLRQQSRCGILSGLFGNGLI